MDEGVRCRTCAGAALGSAQEADLLEDEAGADEDAGGDGERQALGVVGHRLLHRHGFLAVLCGGLVVDAAKWRPPSPIPASSAAPLRIEARKFESGRREPGQGLLGGGPAGRRSAAQAVHASTLLLLV